MMERPSSIKNFERSFWASVLIGIVSFALHWSTVGDTLESDPALSSSVDAAMIAVGIVVGISFAISLLLWYLISRRASNVAKWIYVAVMGFGIISTLASLSDPMSPKGIALAISLASNAITALSIFYLFRPDSRAWFARETVDPRTFD